MNCPVYSCIFLTILAFIRRPEFAVHVDKQNKGHSLQETCGICRPSRERGECCRVVPELEARGECRVSHTEYVGKKNIFYTGIMGIVFIFGEIFAVVLQDLTCGCSFHNLDLYAFIYLCHGEI